MKEYLREEIQGEKFELEIDTNIYSKDIILKAAYNFLDKGYFFFSQDESGNIILQFTRKEGEKEDSEKIIGEFSDELLSVYLRDKLEKDNKDIREKIIGAAIANCIDTNGFTEIDTDAVNGGGNGAQIDFDKDIDEILKEIENDPELKIDEAEIERILKEIEEETGGSVEEEVKLQITLDTNAVKDAKKKFQNK